MIAVQSRRVFPYLVAVTALTAVATGFVAHLIDRRTSLRSASASGGRWTSWERVGYGDVVPHTGWGRVLGSVVIVCRVTFMSFLIAIVTSLFIDANRVAEQESLQARHNEVVELLRSLEARLDAIENAQH